MYNLISTIHQYFEKEAPSVSLAFFRMVFGLVMFVSAARFISLGWIKEQYILPKYHFHYFGFEFVKGVEYFGEIGVYVLFATMVCASIGVVLGFQYRVSSWLYFLTFTYIELLDATFYLNHYYFVSIIALLLCFVPAHSSYSFDALRGKVSSRSKVPAWCVDIFKFQIGIVYVYAGIAKIQPDWLFHALPLRLWLPAQDWLPVIGNLMKYNEVAFAFSWLGMLFDCTIIFFLLSSKTRVAAYVAVVIFHITTGILFQIGVFPLVMSSVVLLFFSDKFHQNCLDLFWNNCLINKITYQKSIHHHECSRGKKKEVSTVLKIAVIGFVLFQLIFPLRFLFYPGQVLWTEQGFRFSWRVMLAEKAATATFFVRDEADTKPEQIVYNREFLTEYQERQMSFQPDLLIQYASILKNYYSLHGMKKPSIRAEVWCTLNGRPSRLLIDSSVNLASLHDSWSDKEWIVRYKE